MVHEVRKFDMILGCLFLFSLLVGVKSQCSQECNALASYYAWDGSNLTFISRVLSTTVNEIVSYNHEIKNPNIIQTGSRVNVPFLCECIDGDFMAHQFPYHIRPRNYYERIAQLIYADLTTVDMLQRYNSYDPNRLPEGGTLNVTVNCTCGNSRVSKEYGLFITYPLRPGESLTTMANKFDLPQSLLQDYNPGVDFGRGTGLVFIPGKDQSGTHPPLESSSSNGISGSAIAGISIAAVVGLVFLAGCFYVTFYRRKKVMEGSLLQAPSEDPSIENRDGRGGQEKASELGHLGEGASRRMKGITVDKSMEFTYRELAVATDDFNLANKIGQGGFGSVYYAELRGERAAIKKMDMQASKEFLAELKVLTHIHHVNLVRLIGYSVEGSLFLVYEYIDNGNLSQHLRGQGRDPLPWSARIQIALDSARGLEYMHEHTVPVYIHRDIKSANILIDKNFHAKVADFGLTKLTEVGSSLHTQLVGTFGYMPPEYAQYGDVSPKIDVYAFGVVLYELISAKDAIVKDAIVKTNEVITESKGLVALFDDAFSQLDLMEAVSKLVDPRLGKNYPLDSVFKMAQLAEACTHENPQLRPSMRSIVVALMTLSSSTEDWDIGSFYENQGLVHLMAGP